MVEISVDSGTATLAGTSPSQIRLVKRNLNLCEISDRMTGKAASLPQFHRRQRSGQNDCSSPENCDHESPIACAQDRPRGKSWGASDVTSWVCSDRKHLREGERQVKAQSPDGWTARGPRNIQSTPTAKNRLLNVFWI